MRRRKLVITFAAAAMFGLLSVPASAELHRVTVRLTNGQELTLTVDVPEGQSVETIQIPNLPAPVDKITDLGPVETPTPTPTQTASPTQTATPTQTRTPSPTSTPQVGRLPSPTPGATSTPAPSSTPARGDKGSNKKQRKGELPNQTDPSTLDPNAESLDGKVGGRAEGEDAPATTPIPDPQQPTQNTDGSPTIDNPTYSLSEPGPARIGVPNFFIEKFRIPPFLLPIYQAAGIEYGIRWEVLAAINEIETDYGRNLNVSSAGALGWMQFMPSTWDMYGVDGNRDGLKDPYNPVDAIFAAARYLKAAGAEQDLRGAIFAYNHADWYVDSVILRARYIAGLPADLVGSLSGLTQGRFPVQAKATYASAVAQDPGQGRQPRLRRRVERPPERHPDLRQARRPGRRGQRRQDRPHGPQPPARQLRRAAGRVRQHVHLRAPEVGRRALPDAEAEVGRRQAGPARAQAAGARRRARRARLRDDAGRGAQAPAPGERTRAQGEGGADARGRRRAREGAAVRQPGPPERGGRGRRRSRSRRPGATSAATSTGSSGSTAPTST